MPAHYEQQDELRQNELERLIRLARKVKSGEVGMGTFKLIDGRLFIEGWKRAA